MLGKRYDSADGTAAATRWMEIIQHAAYRASSDLAKEKGAFPLFDRDAFLGAPSVMALPDDLRETIATNGMRNGLVTSIAPTGTISLFAGNVSSGIEPVFDFAYTRRILNRDGSTREDDVEDYAFALFKQLKGPDAPLAEAFVSATQISPDAHLRMQAALQPHVDSSISKTINCPVDLPFEAFKDIYLTAYDAGLKGCTTFRPNAVTGSVLVASPNVTEKTSSKGSSELASKSDGPASRPDSHSSTAASVVEEPAAPDGGSVIYMSEPLERDAVLAGQTYKLKWPGSDHAIYVTLNDIEQDDRRRPFEIFINSKNLEHYAWTVALTRMISAVFRRGGDVTFVVEELKAIFDPQGGQWVGGRYVPSLLAAIGGIIETHMQTIGFLQVSDQVSVTPERKTLQSGRDENLESSKPGVTLTNTVGQSTPAARFCPRCQQPGLHRSEGCWICMDCGYSKCG